MEDCPTLFERGHQPHENRFIKVPGAEAPQNWRPKRPHVPVGSLILASGLGGVFGALLYALLHIH